MVLQFQQLKFLEKLIKLYVALQFFDIISKPVSINYNQVSKIIKAILLNGYLNYLVIILFTPYLSPGQNLDPGNFKVLTKLDSLEKKLITI